ncbi:hypothetical protein HPP92_014767 [Vanilla planifolia]|uniref:Uncharacterized protein n=1 Tax=Vanilla planifolia TaxID=51239 RepID=A0A835QGM3_VANPL|nr:hypothetical protein HPP92_014767 [Vanilla planifolia]
METPSPVGRPRRLEENGGRPGGQFPSARPCGEAHPEVREPQSKARGSATTRRHSRRKSSRGH